MELIFTLILLLSSPFTILVDPFPTHIHAKIHINIHINTNVYNHYVHIRVCVWIHLRFTLVYFKFVCNMYA